MTLYNEYLALKQREQSIKMRVNEDTQLITVSYLHSGVDFSNALYRRARGLTFTLEGDIILRGFEKFFNHMELEGYDNYTESFKDEFSRIQDTGEPLLVQEKLDGSMILMGVYKGEVIIGTTSSTDNWLVDEVRGFINKDRLLYDSIYRYLTEQVTPKTLIFEFTSPDNQIVVEYGEESLTLLAQVDNQTGKVTDFHETEAIAKTIYWVEAAKMSYYTLDELLHIQQTATGIEGFVVINQYGRRIKVKTEYWFQESGKQDVFFGRKLTKNKVETIIGWYLNDELDDYIAYQNQHGVYRYNDLIGKVMNPLYELFNEVQDTIEEITTNKGIQTRKDMVQWLTKHKEPIIRTHILSQTELTDRRSVKNPLRIYTSYIINYYK